jgi:hypothetical protein
MLNAYYDFNRGGRFEPYIGLGIGATDIEFNDTPPEVDVDIGAAWQAMAGVAIGLTDRLDLDIGYRYFQTIDLDWQEGAPPGGDFDYEHQAVVVGVRWQFASSAPPPPPPPPYVAPPPPPPPVASPVCPQSEFVVYFEWDRSNPTRRRSRPSMQQSTVRASAMSAASSW